MLEIHKHAGTSTNFQAEKTKTSSTLKKVSARVGARDLYGLDYN